MIINDASQKWYLGASDLISPRGGAESAGFAEDGILETALAGTNPEFGHTVQYVGK